MTASTNVKTGSEPPVSSSPVSDHSSTADSASASAGYASAQALSPRCDSTLPVELTPAASNIVAHLRATFAIEGGQKAEEENGDGREEEQNEQRREHPAEEEDAHWKRFPCAQADWDSLHAFLSALGPANGQTKDDVRDPLWGFYYDKIRLDAFCDRGFAVLRMPGDRHAWFGSRLVVYLLEAIRAVQARGDAPECSEQERQIARHSKRICLCNSRVFHYVMPAGKDNTQYKGDHHPDMSFCVCPVRKQGDVSIFAKEADFNDLPIAGLMIEISDSQKRKDLDTLADHYLLGTKGNEVKLMLAFDLNSRGRGARVIAYRRKVELVDGQREISVVKTAPQEFESSTGELVPGQVTLLLSDFGPRINVPAD